MTFGKVIGKWFCVNHRAIFVLIRIGIVVQKMSFKNYSQNIQYVDIYTFLCK